jgi:HEAT repeat protein
VSQGDLEVVVNWRLVGAAAAGGLLLLAVPVAVALLGAVRAPSGDGPAAAPAPPGPATTLPPLPWSGLRARAEAPPPPLAPPEPLPPPSVEHPRSLAAPPVGSYARARRPVPDEAIPPGPARDGASGSRRHRPVYSEEELLEQLYRQTRVVDLDTESGTAEKVLKETTKVRPPEGAPSRDKDAPYPLHQTEPVLDLFARRADLKGLPVRQADCRAPAKAADTLGKLSRELRADGLRLPRARGDSGVSHSELSRLDRALIAALRDKEWCTEEALPALVQMFQADSAPVRGGVVAALERVKGEKASAALASRALFDPAAGVRGAAVKALASRPREEYRDVLLKGLRYPWAPVADHAAEALVALEDRRAVPRLVELLDEPDPGAPARTGDGKWAVTELVRVNHLRNCLLCHAASLDRSDPVRGLVPERGKPLREEYYESQKGDFVRADVTYLKQDFSAMQPVPDHGEWPRLQRFDYLLRTRELTADEAKGLGDGPRPATYPQREAVLWALRRLTGIDAGAASADWRRALLALRLTEGM